MSLADTGLTSTVDTGAALALYPPDVPLTVAAPSFDPTINYVQAPVAGAPGTFDPTGYVQAGPQAVDATQAALINANTMPISTEDAVAYSATLAPAIGTTTTFGPSGIETTTAYAGGGESSVFNPAGSLIKNGSALTGAQTTIAPNVGSGGPNAWMHGISDALTSVVNAAVAVDVLSNVKNPTQTQGTATPMAQGQAGLLSPLTSQLQTPPLFSAATVPGQGGGISALFSSPLLLIAIAVGVYFMVKHG